MNYLFPNLKIEKIVLYLICFHLCVLMSAYYIQYFMKIPACKLCLYQRIPYMFSLIVLMYIYVLKKYVPYVVWLLIFTAFINIVLSLYHVGIENEFFSEPGVCTIKNTINNPDLLLENLKRNMLVKCKDVYFKISGLSLASINFLLSIVLIVLYALLIIKWQKIKN